VTWVTNFGTASEEPGVFVVNAGAGVVAAEPVLRTAAGAFARSASGRIRARFASAVTDGNDLSVVALHTGADLVDYRFVGVWFSGANGGPEVTFDVYDNAENQQGPLQGPELAAVGFLDVDAEWLAADPGAGLRVRMRPELRYGGIDTDPDWHELAVAWPTTAAPSLQIDLGSHIGGAGSPLRGYLETVEIYGSRP
jgi:hypothetical protein